MNQMNHKIFIADPGCSEMRVGIAGDVIPQYRKAFKENSTSSSKLNDENEWTNSIGKEKQPSKSSLKSPGKFMNDQYLNFFSNKIKDSNSSVIVIEKNVQ